MRRISAVADRLITHAEALAEHTEHAGRLHGGIDELIEALASAAEAIAAEAGRKPISLPGLGDGPPVVTHPRLVTESDDPMAGRVQEAAELLPPRPTSSPQAPVTPPPRPRP
jgi:hypothetical protein